MSSIAYLGILDLADNQLTGSIPPDLGSLTYLNTLNLSVNQLTGEIPAGMGNLTNLLHLSLKDNRLTGSIPPYLGNLTRLRSMHLSVNQLTGCIPTGLRAGVDLGLLGLDFCTGSDTGQPPTGIEGGDCAVDGAVASPANNPGLVADCNVLLAARDTLEGTGTLNWSASTYIGIGKVLR